VDILRPPCEIIVQELLPLLRGLIAYELTQKMTQQEAAERMGVSQPTISAYLKSLARAQETGEAEYLDNPTIKHLVVTLQDKIAQNATAEELIQSLCATCVTLRIGGLTCRRHFEVYPSLSQGCSACLPALEKELTKGRQKVLAELTEAVALIEAEPMFVKLVPEVLLNICQSLPDPKTTDDVAAIPGRITKIRGATKALLAPEFGVSRHLARILLVFHHFKPGVQSIIGIRFSPEIKATLEVMNHPILERDNRFFDLILEKSPFEVELDSEVLTFLQEIPPGKVFAIINTGAIGIEPITYLFASSAVALARLCCTIARKI